MSAIAASPIAFLSAGLLADRLFEPLMTDAAGIVAQVLGSGPGRGMGLMFVLAGLLVITTALVAYRHPRIRALEIDVPDLELSDVAA